MSRFWKKKPPVITEPNSSFSQPNKRRAGRRGGKRLLSPYYTPHGPEDDFEVDEYDGPKPRAPWLTSGLLLAVTAALFGVSVKYDFLLGQIVVPILGLTTLHGLLRGGFRKIIMLPATVLVAGFLLTDPSIADPIVRKINGVPSVTGNYVACAVMGILALALIAWPVKAIRRSVIMKRRSLRVSDRIFGTGIGFAEGAFAALLLMWGTVLVEPHAKRVADHPDARPVQQQFAEGVMRLASEIDRTPLAPIVRDANLLTEFPSIRETLGVVKEDGSIDPPALDAKTCESIFELLESLGLDKSCPAAAGLHSCDNEAAAEA